MPDFTVSTPVDTFMQSADQAGMQTNIGVPALLALKANLVWTLNAMAALEIDATPYTLNTKSVSVNSTLTQAGLQAQGPYRLVLQNTAVTPVTITLPTAGAVSFFSEGLGASRLTFVMPGSSTRQIIFMPVSATSIFMLNEPVSFDLFGAGTATDPTTDLVIVQQSTAAGMVLVKKTPNALLLRQLVDANSFPAIRGGADRTAQLVNNDDGLFDPTSGGEIFYSQAATTALYRLFSRDNGIAQIEFPDNKVSNVILNASSQDLRLINQADSTSTTLVNLDELTPEFTAGQIVDFEFVLHIDASAVGGHKVKLASDGTLAVSDIVYTIESLDLTGNVFVIADRITSLGAAAVGQAGATIVRCIIRGSMVVTTGGALVPQFAQNAANGTSSVLVGSTGKFRNLSG